PFNAYFIFSTLLFTCLCVYVPQCNIHVAQCTLGRCWCSSPTTNYTIIPLYHYTFIPLYLYTYNLYTYNLYTHPPSPTPRILLHNRFQFIVHLCHVPGHVLHGDTDLVVPDKRAFVIVQYSCEAVVEDQHHG